MSPAIEGKRKMGGRIFRVMGGKKEKNQPLSSGDPEREKKRKGGKGGALFAKRSFAHATGSHNTLRGEGGGGKKAWR